VTFELADANITSSTNGFFNASTGTITVLPKLSSNQQIPAGATDNSITFCATRTVSGGTTPPTLRLTTATF
jgi:hypothetical protein